jgi:hypothetical protein
MITAASTLAAVLCISACGGGGGSPGVVDSAVIVGPAALIGSGTSNSVLGLFRGTAISVIEDDNLFGQIIGTRQFQIPVRVDIGFPATLGGLIELNPFRLGIAPDSGTSFGQEGQLSIQSSAFALGSTIPGRAPDEVLFQFWELAFDRTTLVGRLTNTRQAESAVFTNALFLNTGFAPSNGTVLSECPMRAGSALRGKLDGNQVTLRIEGSVVCTGGTSLSKRFTVDIHALRTA